MLKKRKRKNKKNIETKLSNVVAGKEAAKGKKAK